MSLGQHLREVWRWTGVTRAETMKLFDIMSLHEVTVISRDKGTETLSVTLSAGNCAYYPLEGTLHTSRQGSQGEFGHSAVTMSALFKMSSSVISNSIVFHDLTIIISVVSNTQL